MTMPQNPQLEGVSTIPGTYPFDLRVNLRTRRLNTFLWNLRLPDHRATFMASEAASMQAAGLTNEEQRLVTARDWLGLVKYGVNFFVLEKFARVAKTTNLEMYAQMRGETFEEFLATRRVPDAR
jgi:gallate dioxygenase